MKQGIRVPTDTFQVRMHAYCGVSYDVATGLSRKDAIRRAARFVARRRRDGYGISHELRGEEASWELTEPETAFMVPDDAGNLVVARETVPGYECWTCGYEVAVGEECSCAADADAGEELDTEGRNA